ncbi:MAG TPA: TetR/AcrR family transcriptional regulator [Symbiobacteriaceae bacterium]|jgi:AcrR family transcriptional regulator
MEMEKQMTSDDSLPDKGRPGRPRSAEAEQAILNTTLDMLAEVGIEALSIEGVAAAAGVGKTTIYRRWASKEELIVAAIRMVQVDVPFIDTGNLRDGLLALAHAAQQKNPRAAFERLLPRFLGEGATRPALFRMYLDAALVPRIEQFCSMVERAQARGEIRSDLDPMIVFSLFGGALLSGWMVLDKLSPLPPDFAEQAIDTLWRGIRTTP